jgi:hypothetical protein
MCFILDKYKIVKIFIIITITSNIHGKFSSSIDNTIDKLNITKQFFLFFFFFLLLIYKCEGLLYSAIY